MKNAKFWLDIYWSAKWFLDSKQFLMQKNHSDDELKRRNNFTKQKDNIPLTIIILYKKSFRINSDWKWNLFVLSCMPSIIMRPWDHEFWIIRSFLYPSLLFHHYQSSHSSSLVQLVAIQRFKNYLVFPKKSHLHFIVIY